ncbi:MAG: helix-turn-helix transcriptional regulator [Coriobacteriaceae bacterium]
MSFRDNLQHLRATHAMTQEQLALMLGVSRQSVTKWEAEKSYPEMDKLLKLCQIFDVTLEDLVQGDLTTSVPTAAVQARAAVLREAAGGPPQDVCGYDEHMRAFAWKIAWGVRYSHRCGASHSRGRLGRATALLRARASSLFAASPSVSALS